MTFRRGGFTLVELIVATALATLVGSAVVGVLVRQQRFYRAASEMLEVRAQLRDAGDVLASDIRGAVVADFGLPLMSDSAIELFATIGASVACTAPSGSVLGLPPSSLASGNTLTSLVAQPDTGDLALVYGIPSGHPDSGRWETRRIVAFVARSLASTCPTSSGFTTGADAAAGATGYQATLESPATIAVRKGAPVRFVRRVRYSLYRSSDGRWYLGYRRCNATGPPSCAAVQPVSGPYLPYSVAVGSGIAFRYYDSSGAELDARSSSVALARVDIVVRAETSSAPGLTGDSRAAYRDSVVVTVSPRNRTR